MKGMHVVASLTLSIVWLAGLALPADRAARAAEPAGVPAGLTAAEWSSLKTQLAKLEAGGGMADDWFGCSVAVSGSIIVVGAPGVDVEGRENEGAAYVFYRTASGAWEPWVRLTAADGAAGDNFGYSVAIYDHEHIYVGIIVGSPLADPGDDVDRGAAYIFRQDAGGVGAWGQVAKLTASDGAAGDQFGYSVSAALWGKAIAGAPFADISGRPDQGAVYAFSSDSGQYEQEAKLTAADGAADDYFGGSVAYQMATAVIGADSADVGDNPNQGAAYVFYHTEPSGPWDEVEKLTASDGTADASFGYSVALDRDAQTALAGARNAAPNGVYLQGAAYIYYRDQGGPDAWNQVARLTAADGASEDSLGWSVSLDEGVALVGAPYAHVSGIWDQGAAYLFYRDQGGPHVWGQVAKLAGAGAVSDDRTGCAVAIRDGTAVAATPFADVEAHLDMGAAYVYDQDQGGANAWGQTATLAASNTWHEDNFGWSVAVDGDTAVVGAYRADIAGRADQGAAYVFCRNRGGAGAWGFVATLLPLDGAPGDGFGWSVSVSGNYAIVGAPYADVGGYMDQGAAYLFLTLPGIPWGQGAKFVLDEGTTTDYFGASVAIDGPRIVVGANAADPGGSADQGAAYVWDMDAGGLWHRMATLTAADGGPGDQFGYSVSLSGDTALVGARFADPDGAYLRGAAYIFDRNQGGADAWDQVARLTAAGGGAEDQFGRSVSLSGDTAIVGAPLADVGANADQGAAYAFNRDLGGANMWGQRAKLTGTAGAAEDWFGWSVAVSGDRLSVGAPGVDVGSNSNEGLAYLYNRGATDSWSLVDTLTASDGDPGDNFGFSVAADGSTVVVGACLSEFGPMIDEGAAYVFRAAYRAYLPLVARNE